MTETIRFIGLLLLTISQGIAAVSALNARQQSKKFSTMWFFVACIPAFLLAIQEFSQHNSIEGVVFGSMGILNIAIGMSLHTINNKQRTPLIYKVVVISSGLAILIAMSILLYFPLN